MGVELTKKYSKTAKEVIFKGRGSVILIRTKGYNGVAFGGRIDSKIFKNGQGLSKIWSFSRGEVA